MTTPPYFPDDPRVAVAKALTAAGAVQTAAHHDVWKIVNGWGELAYIDLREVFPTPFTAQQSEPACICWKQFTLDPHPVCPVHGEAS